MMEFQSVQYTVDSFVRWIRAGRLAIPDFQRDFVWGPTRVVELLESVARQWPIGSLLLLSGPQPFGVRAIEGAPSVQGSEHLDMYVLDGQQRLTALFHAVGDASEFVYYVDFREVLSGSDEFIHWERRKRFERQFKTRGDRARAGVALIVDLWEASDFHDWIGFVEDAESKRAFAKAKDQELSGLSSQVYKLVAIQLDRQISLEALARIFESLNRNPMRLNAFDLMVAMLYPRGFNLRDAWQSALSSSELLRKYEVDPLEILKLLSVLVRMKHGAEAAPGVRQGDLLRLDRRLIQVNWDDAVSRCEEALLMARDEFGVFSADVVPSWSLIMCLAAWHVRLGSDARRSSDVRTWFWASVVKQTYSQAANTRLIADVDHISRGEAPSAGPIDFSDLEVFALSARRNGMALRGFACLLARLGGMDVVSGQRLSSVEHVAYYVAEEGGSLRRLTSDDSFAQVVVISEDSERALRRKSSGAVDAKQYQSGLGSQWISADDGRTQETYWKMLSTALAAGGKNVS